MKIKSLMSAPLESYLRTYRKRSGLSQDEVAFLLGSASGAKISRYERLSIQPKLETALAYEAIFQIPVRDLFAGLYQKVEREIMERLRLLTEKVSDAKLNRVTAHKLTVLRSLCQALTSALRQSE